MEFQNNIVLQFLLEKFLLSTSTVHQAGNIKDSFKDLESLVHYKNNKVFIVL